MKNILKIETWLSLLLLLLLGACNPQELDEYSLEGISTIRG